MKKLFVPGFVAVVGPIAFLLLTGWGWGWGPGGWPVHRLRIIAIGLTAGATALLVCVSLSCGRPSTGTGASPPTPGTVAPRQLDVERGPRAVWVAFAGCLVACGLWFLLPISSGHSIISVLCDTDRTVRRLDELAPSAPQTEIKETLRAHRELLHTLELFPEVKRVAQKHLNHARARLLDRSIDSLAGQLSTIAAVDIPSYTQVMSEFDKWLELMPAEMRDRVERTKWVSWGRRATDDWVLRVKCVPVGEFDGFRVVEADGLQLDNSLNAFHQTFSKETADWGKRSADYLIVSIHAVAPEDIKQFIMVSSRADPILQSFPAHQEAIKNAKEGWGGRWVEAVADRIAQQHPRDPRAALVALQPLDTVLITQFGPGTQPHKKLFQLREGWGVRWVEAVADQLAPTQAQEPLAALAALRRFDTLLNAQFGPYTLPQKKLFGLRRDILRLAEDRALAECREGFLARDPETALVAALRWRESLNGEFAADPQVEKRLIEVAESYRYLIKLKAISQ